GERAGAPVLPGGAIRTAARPGLRHGAGDRGAVLLAGVRRARLTRDGGDRYTRLQPRDVLPGSARVAVARPYGQATMVGVAQLAERQVVVLDVAGSNPVAHPIGSAGQRPRLNTRPGPYSSSARQLRHPSGVRFWEPSGTPGTQARSDASILTPTCCLTCPNILHWVVCLIALPIVVL